MRYLTTLIVLLMMVSVSHAQEKRVSDEAELSFVDTGGNTDVTTLSAKNLLKYKFSEKIEGGWKVGALYGKSDGEKNAESYFMDLRLDYLFTKKLYGAALTGWLRDEFSGIDSRYDMGIAAGYKFLTGPKHGLVGEAGLNYVKEEYTDDTDKDYLEGRAFAGYSYSFSEKNKFSQSLEYLYDFDDSGNYGLKSETALISALTGVISLKAGYEIKYDGQPVPSTLDKTDTTLSLALVANF